ncbi:ParB/RepB/Spo0J family partition protein (plasmid) [Azospirillum oryzae]|uniref:ParB/RepB/Spo0J family partition protein n=2 Tax=Azospirillum TaxID=191 RepID=A0A6N1AS45_9PROT|nr:MULTISPECIES: ParB/RepB/Spo0J family partition protein [Azospirillum]QKS54615.1 ParB/RepB/Spo0J family partition protein [Azospirillum oryzae]GLR77497.1 DNA-binding protein [Azospirillum oryzae]
MIKSIALSNLRRSDRNVRKTYPFADVQSMAADIKARGLLQNLIVIPTEADDDTFEVVGGGRRLAALELLRTKGEIDGTYAVDCAVREADEAEEVSLAENVQRVNMTPVDEYRAFAALLEQGKTAENIAIRFGLPVRAVQQRLKLGRLSPRLLDLFRDGKIDKDVCEAFTLSDDHAIQERVYDALKQSHSLHPYHIRKELAQERVPVTSKLGTFVRADYVAKGLPVTEDLFKEDGTYLDDRTAALEIATEKLRRECDRLVAEGWAWAKPMLEYDHAVFASMRSTRPDQERQLTADQEDERLALVVAHNEILSRYHPELTVGRPGGAASVEDDAELEDDEDEGDYEDGFDEGDEDAPEIPQEDLDRMAELKRLIARIDASKGRFYSAELRAKAGVFVLIGSDGDFDLREGYIAPDAAGEGEAAKAASAGTLMQTCSDRCASKPARGPYTAALVTDLEAHRTQAFQLALAQEPQYAKSYLIYTLWVKLSMRCNMAAASNLSGHFERLSGSVVKMGETPAGAALAKMLNAFKSMIEPEDGYSGREALPLFQTIHSLSDADKDAVLAVLFAQTISVSLSEHGGKRDDVVEHIGTEIGCDPARTWRPTAPEFWSRVSKGFVLDEVAVVGKGVQTLAPAKKAQMVSTLDRWFGSPDAIMLSELGPVAAAADAPIPQDMVAGIQQWLPPGMAFAAAEEEGSLVTGANEEAA